MVGMWDPTQPAGLRPAPGEMFGLGRLQAAARPAPGHTAGTELGSGAPLLSQLRSCQEEERGFCSVSGEAMLTFLASWPPWHAIILSLSLPAFPWHGSTSEVWGTSGAGAGKSCLLPSRCPGPLHGQGRLSTCWRTMAQHSACSPSCAGSQVKYCPKMLKSRR